MNHSYRMSRQETKKFLRQMSENVPFGIYAIEKDGIIEMRKDRCGSMSKLKEMKREFKRQGYKVYYNTGER